ncbi:sigma-70 domain-containing protein [Lachnospira pectinoschiza]|uniref:RNA polymerase primary sigma factor n=1 Tax=Lachnospira pectinoschiza TaxID=28052 RepID=A0A1G9VWC3_9FIRM|nr:sigma-70 domain-containing protein [Lachnospira pectinoschiza]SDM76490.1 RNA polymerase primary sigma factor [Lachnospira pectinoschiza]
MADNNQAAFMEALNSLKEYAKVNGNIINQDDINSYFKDLSLDETKMGMITGYLLAHNITVSGEEDNQFKEMFKDETKPEDSKDDDENVTIEGIDLFSSKEDVDEKDANVAKEIANNLNYEEDEKYLKLYLDDLARIQPLSDTSKAFLLMNIVEDNDKESLAILSESYLEKVIEWITPYRNKGVLASDLVQEANLAMMSYIGEKKWLNNYEWKDKIKEGSTEDLLYVLGEINKAVKSEIEDALDMLLDEEGNANLVTGKILNKVNKVNDFAKGMMEDLGRKPTVKEVAAEMKVSEDEINEAISLSAENIENIDYPKTIKKK